MTNRQFSVLGGNTMKKSWMYVALTCLFELLWVFGLNRADAVWEWAIIICLIPVDFYFLMKACEKLPTGTVYAVFAGVGTIGTSLMDYALFGGSFSLEKLLFMGILILGIIGLKVSGFLYCWPLPAKLAEPLVSICSVRKSNSRQAFYLSADLPYPFCFCTPRSLPFKSPLPIRFGLDLEQRVLSCLI